MARVYGAAALRTRDAAVPLFSRCAHRPLVFAVFSLTRHRSAPLLPPESIPFTSDLKKICQKISARISPFIRQNAGAEQHGKARGPRHCCLSPGTATTVCILPTVYCRPCRSPSFLQNSDSQ